MNDFDTVKINEIVKALPLGLIVFDKTFLIEFVNSHYLDYTKETSSSLNLIGKDIRQSEFCKKTVLEPELQSILNGIGFEKQISTQKMLSGDEILLIAKGFPLINGQEVTGGLLIVEDFHLKHSVLNGVTDIFNGNNDAIKYFSDFVVTVDVTGKIISFNKNPYSESKVNISLEKNINLFAYLPSSISDSLRKMCSESVLNQSMQSGKFILISQNSSDCYLMFKVIPVKNNQLNDVNLIITIDEIDRHEYFSEPDNELEELKQYQSMMENIADAIIQVTREGLISYWSENASELFGITRIEVFNKFIGKVIPELNKSVYENIIDDLETMGKWESEIKIEQTNRIFKIKLLKKNSESILIILEDISKRKLIEKDLRQSEEQFRNLVINSTELICIVSAEGKIKYSNPSFNDYFQIDKLANTEKYFTELIDSNYLYTSFNDILSGRIKEIDLTNRFNEKKSFLLTISEIKNLNSKTNNYNIILTDISERKKLEKDLILTKSVFESTHDGIAVFYERKLIIANISFCELFEYNTIDEILNLDPLDFVSNDNIPKVAKYIKTLEKQEKIPDNFDFIGITKNKKIKYFSVSANSYLSDDKLYIVLLFRDITEQRETQEALVLSEERYRNITENINEFIWAAEKKANRIKTILLTKAVEHITGYQINELQNNSLNWFRFIHPDDYNFVMERLKKFFKNISKNSDELECRIINRDGNTIWIQNKITIERNLRNEISKIYGIISDISIKKRAEEEMKQSAENLKLLNETKDKFISIISHDLRTPFSSILGFTDLLLTDTEMQKDKQLEYIGFIRESSKNMLSLVNSLLDWTRLQTGRIHFQPQNINIANAVKKVFQMLQGVALQKEINLITELPEELIIHADENLIIQLFNNLISNAIKFTNQKGFIKVYAEQLPGKNQLVFTVKDNGTGIKEENIVKLFRVDSKFTLKGTAGEKGSGLGLSLCHEIVEKHNGRIWVESKFGDGSEFKFTLPVSSNTILLVDTLVTDRILYNKLIKSLVPEYEIVEASGITEAYEIIEEIQPSIIILEHDLVDGTGYELVKKIKFSELKPKPGMILLSREMHLGNEDEYKDFGIEYLFSKPVNINLLKNAIIQIAKKAMFN